MCAMSTRPPPRPATHFPARSKSARRRKARPPSSSPPRSKPRLPFWGAKSAPTIWTLSGSRKQVSTGSLAPAMRSFIWSLISPLGRKRPAPGPLPKAPKRRRPPASFTPISSTASSAPRPSAMTTMSPATARRARATPARCGSKARIMSCMTVTSCIFASLPDTDFSFDLFRKPAAAFRDHALTPHAIALIPDRAEVLVDAEDDEHEFGDNARHDHAHEGAKHAGNQKDHAGKRIKRHGRQRTDDAGKAEQDRKKDGEPEKHFEDGGRYEPLPLEQIAQTEHDNPRLIPRGDS